MNGFLNGKVQETHPGNTAAKQKRVPIQYLHRHEKDEFFELPTSYNRNLPPAVQEMLKEHGVWNRSQKLRISRDQKTQQIIAMIMKARIADLDILFPESPLDCRISVNFEMRFDGSVEEAMGLVTENRQPDRQKDRMSYTQSHYQIDLTQVTQIASVNVSTLTISTFPISQPAGYESIRERARAGNRAVHRGTQGAGAKSCGRSAAEVSCVSRGTN